MNRSHHKAEKTKDAAPDQESASSKNKQRYHTKQDRILTIMRAGRSLNRFEAESLGDHCLHSTIATLRREGHLFHDTWERVPTRFRTEVRVKRYRYIGSAT